MRKYSSAILPKLSVPFRYSVSTQLLLELLLEVIVSATLHYAAKKQAKQAYATGYDKGKSDAVKQQYWLYVSMQRQRNQVANVRLSPVQLPEQRSDGVTFQPSTKYLRI